MSKSQNTLKSLNQAKRILIEDIRTRGEITVTASHPFFLEHNEGADFLLETAKGSPEVKTELEKLKKPKTQEDVHKEIDERLDAIINYEAETVSEILKAIDLKMNLWGLKKKTQDLKLEVDDATVRERVQRALDRIGKK